MIYKYLVNIISIEQLRKEYIKLLKRYHPDNGGDVAIMQAINAEYAILLKTLARTDNSEATQDKQADYNKEPSKELQAMLYKVVNLNCDIELIGSWIWCFNAYNVKDILKSYGFSYASKRKAWVWHTGDYKKHHSNLSIDEIRGKYGSVTYNCKKQYAID